MNDDMDDALWNGELPMNVVLLQLAMETQRRKTAERLVEQLLARPFVEWKSLLESTPPRNGVGYLVYSIVFEDIIIAEYHERKNGPAMWISSDGESWARDSFSHYAELVPPSNDELVRYRAMQDADSANYKSGIGYT